MASKTSGRDRLLALTDSLSALVGLCAVLLATAVTLLLLYASLPLATASRPATSPANIYARPQSPQQSARAPAADLQGHQLSKPAGVLYDRSDFASE